MDPFYATKETTTGIVIRSVQKFPRYKPTYQEVVIRLKDGSTVSYPMPINLSWKTGDKVHFRTYKRRITGFKKYLPESSHSIEDKHENNIPAIELSDSSLFKKDL